jgi:hypothetical protein
MKKISLLFLCAALLSGCAENNTMPAPSPMVLGTDAPSYQAPAPIDYPPITAP